MGTEIGQLLQQLKIRLERALGVPIRLILFGSHARGEASEDSDVDVLVILPRLDRKMLDTLLNISWEVSFEAGLVLSPIPVGEDEIGRISMSPFFQSVEREGIRI